MIVAARIAIVDTALCNCSGTACSLPRNRRGHGITAAMLAIAMLFTAGACKRDDNEIPELQGGKAPMAAEPAV